jgi:hypothetical protein
MQNDWCINSEMLCKLVVNVAQVFAQFLRSHPAYEEQHRCKIDPNSTNVRQGMDNFDPRAAGNGTRIRNLRAESSRNQVSLLMLVSEMRPRKQLRLGRGPVRDPDTQDKSDFIRGLGSLAPKPALPVSWPVSTQIFTWGPDLERKRGRVAAPFWFQISAPSQDLCRNGPGPRKYGFWC